MSAPAVTPKQVRSLIWRCSQTQSVPLGDGFRAVAAVMDKQISGDAGQSSDEGIKEKQLGIEVNTKMKSYKSYSGRMYLAKEDFPEPEILTIEEVREEEVTAPGKKPKKKLVIYFTGWPPNDPRSEKGLVSNITHGDVLFEMTGSQDPEKWVGQTVEVYCDPNVMYGSEKKGGIRMRPAPAAPKEEEVPF